MFSILSGLFKLADWTRWVTIHWHEWNYAFWTVIMGWTGFSVPPLIIPILSFSVFTIMVVIGTVLRLADHVFPGDKADDSKWKQRKLLRFAKWIVIIVVWTGLGLMFVGLYAALVGGNAGYLMLVAIFVIPVIAIIYSSGDRKQCLYTVVLFMIFWVLLVIIPFFQILAPMQQAGYSAPKETAIAALVSIFFSSHRFDCNGDLHAAQSYQ
jgi:hypothetical protein